MIEPAYIRTAGWIYECYVLTVASRVVDSLHSRPRTGQLRQTARLVFIPSDAFPGGESHDCLKQHEAAVVITLSLPVVGIPSSPNHGARKEVFMTHKRLYNLILG